MTTINRADRVHGSAGMWRPVPRPPDTTTCTNPYRGPHNRCTHPTPTPAGYHRCAGENGCPYLIADIHLERLCPAHDDDRDVVRPYRDLLDTP